MKKIIIVTLFLLSAGLAANAQNYSNNQLVVKTDIINPVNLFENGKYNNIPSGTHDKETYLQKSRNQRTIGWCFVSAGAVGLAIGLASFPTNGDILFTSEEDASKADRANTITVIGSALMLGSIPFFVLSNVNKRKARLVVSSQKRGLGYPQR